MTPPRDVPAVKIAPSLLSADFANLARDVARVAGQRDWITPHMLDTINRADYGMTDEVGVTFRVTAKALGDEPPPHWPADACGYTTDLTVLARTEEEARELALAWLQSLEPPTATFDLSVDRVPVPTSTSSEGNGCPRGVLRIDSLKAYLRA